jgi:DNA-binding NarL/FixJ family response regulator
MTILIVDDNDVFRSSARAVVQAAGYDVVGEAEDVAGAVAQVHALHPDVVLLDIQLPDGDGFALADQLAAEEGAPTVVLISSRERADYGSRVDDAPAAGFINKLDLSGASLEALIGHG